MKDKHLTIVECRIDHTIIAFLPRHKTVSLFVDHHILIFQWHQYGINVDGKHPLGLSKILHTQIAGLTPIAQSGMTAHDGHRLARL